MLTSSALTVAVSGLALGLALIAAIGPQNAFVLRQGLRGEHVKTVVGLCIVSDVVLVTAVVASAGAVRSLAPAVLTTIRWCGVAYLAAYAVLAARRALRPATLEVATDGRSHRRETVASTLAMTWLNPHVYVDTLLVVGPLAATLGPDRWAFGSGVLVASTVWFVGLGVGARLLRPLFRRPTTWRLLDAGVAATMAVLALTLARGG